MITPIEGDGHFRPVKGFNQVPENRVDVPVVYFELAPTGRRALVAKDEVDSPVLILKVAQGSVGFVVVVASPG